jgi:hypothetical protein
MKKDKCCFGARVALKMINADIRKDDVNTKLTAVEDGRFKIEGNEKVAHEAIERFVTRYRINAT